MIPNPHFCSVLLKHPESGSTSNTQTALGHPMTEGEENGRGSPSQAKPSTFLTECRQLIRSKAQCFRGLRAKVIWQESLFQRPEEPVWKRPALLCCRPLCLSPHCGLRGGGRRLASRGSLTSCCPQPSSATFVRDSQPGRDQGGHLAGITEFPP